MGREARAMTNGAPQRLNRGHLRRRPHGTPTGHSIGAETLNGSLIRLRFALGQPRYGLWQTIHAPVNPPDPRLPATAGRWLRRVDAINSFRVSAGRFASFHV